MTDKNEKSSQMNPNLADVRRKVRFSQKNQFSWAMSSSKTMKSWNGLVP